MRVLFVAWRDLAHPKAGGSEVVVDELARGLVARGHQVTVLCGGPVGVHGYEVVHNGGEYTQYLLAPLRYGLRFRDADLVVEVANGMPFFSPAWRRGPRLCMVHHVHAEQWERYFPRPVAATFGALESRGFPLAYRGTHFLTISDSSGEDLAAMGIAREHIHVLRLGARIDAPAPVPAASSPPVSGPTFLALGRLAPNKRLDLLLDHWAKVAAHTGGRLVIVGDGPDRAALEARVAADPGLTGVVFTGKVDERHKAELLTRADLLVHTAEREGWGLNIVEAARCGTPSLAYDVGGVRDAIVDGETGALARTGDEFVQRWIALANDGAERARLGEAAASRAAAFTWERYVDSFLEIAEAAIVESCRPVRTRAAHPLHNPLAAGPETGLARSAYLMQRFRREADEPDRFYHYLAADTMRHIGRYLDVAGCSAIDVGGGPGYTAEALAAAGARCTVVDYSHEEFGLHDRTPDTAVQGDAQALPLRAGSAQLVHSSNVLEHVPDWRSMLDEMVRVLEPGAGVGYLNFTNWYSPWGGHETSPWHYLGGTRAVERYRRVYGKRPKNEFGVSLFPLHITSVLGWFEGRRDVDVLWVGPRYLPEWTRWIVRVRGVREIVTWNLVVVFRRTA